MNMKNSIMMLKRKTILQKQKTTTIITNTLPKLLTATFWKNQKQTGCLFAQQKQVLWMSNNDE